MHLLQTLHPATLATADHIINPTKWHHRPPFPSPSQQGLRRRQTSLRHRLLPPPHVSAIGRSRRSIPILSYVHSAITPALQPTHALFSSHTGTAEYKLHYLETPTQLRLVLLTSPQVGNMRTVLHQIWATLFVEYVVKSPLAPTEHTGGKGVGNELFEGGLERFMVSLRSVLF